MRSRKQFISKSLPIYKRRLSYAWAQLPSNLIGLIRLLRRSRPPKRSGTLQFAIDYLIMWNSVQMFAGFYPCKISISWNISPIIREFERLSDAWDTTLELLDISLCSYILPSLLVFRSLRIYLELIDASHWTIHSMRPIPSINCRVYGHCPLTRKIMPSVWAGLVT